MNSQLQKLFSIIYSPEQTDNLNNGASSVTNTSNLRIRIGELFTTHHIKSIFDAGCNDCGWMRHLIDSTKVDYRGGDISLAMVADVWRRHPELDVQVHDATTDSFPTADLLFVRDVAIHLNNQDKQKLWQNWANSNIPWILITHNLEVSENFDFEYSEQLFPFSSANWNISPWNFPAPVDLVSEYDPGDRSMGLWHQDQFKGIL
jgi:hypothetical protein